jgi:hypothetical protein
LLLLFLLQSKTITRLIRNAPSIQQLHAIVSQHSRSLNAINLAAAFSRAQTLSGQIHQQEQQQAVQLAANFPTLAAAAAADTQALLEDLTFLWQQHIHQATPRELTSVLLAASKLGLLDAGSWSNTMSALLQHVDNANSQDVSSAVYALASIAGANHGRVPGVDRQQLVDAVLTLTTRVCRMAAARSSSSGCSSGSGSSRAPGDAAGSSSSRAVNSISPQAISNLLWALAKLGICPPLTETLQLLQFLAHPRVLSSADPLALGNTLWAVSELQQLPGWAKYAETPPGAANSAASMCTELPHAVQGAGVGGVGQPLVVRAKGGQQRRQQQLQVIPPQLLSAEQMGRLAAASSQSVSNAVLALSRWALWALEGSKLWLC